MVTRKSTADDSSADSNAPKPVSLQGVRQELWSATDSEPDPENIWGDRDSRQDAPSQASGQPSSSQLQDIPAALRPGAVPGSPFDEEEEENPWDDDRKESDIPVLVEPKPKVELEKVPTVLRPGGRLETNPFKRKPVGAGVSGENSPLPSKSPAPSEPRPPTEAFSGLQLAEPEPSTNPWRPTIDEQKAPSTSSQLPSVADQESSSNIWVSEEPSRQPSRGPADGSPAIVSLPSDAESPWDEDEPPKSSLPPMPETHSEEQEIAHDAHAWDDVGPRDKGKAPVAPQRQVQSGTGEDWNLIDHQPAEAPSGSGGGDGSAWDEFLAAEQPKEPTPAIEGEVPPPALPPRKSTEQPPPQPPQPQSPSSANKSETYQIKNINWFDSTTRQNPRKSPILVQNANGPCPLVALVNALTLTTPADLTSTVLVETLRSREQISLNLLLEAVFDELMSARRSKPDVPLPDVTELYNFLRGLHTGMNVNPRFIPTPELVTALKRTSLTHVHPSERGDLIPGTFEDTRDMKLYATFSVPLLHGWLPPKDDPAYQAFSRQATSYDEVQTLLFREEELEHKLTTEGLSEQEQQLYQDIFAIKNFLTSSATQLTKWGLEVITKALKPGTFSILFRNDHFSTLYRHPQTGQLFTLVTDAGYHSHDEVVWESLIDVSGEQAEFFSGDFRLVGGPNTQQQPQRNSVPGAWYDEGEAAENQNNGDWQTVHGRRPRNKNRHAKGDVPLSPKAEQEDRDLALALQLQEEEEARHRQEQAARRREDQLSEQYIEQQGRQPWRPPNSQGDNPQSRGARSGGNAARRSSGSQPINVPIRGGGSDSRGGRGVQRVRSLVPPENPNPVRTPRVTPEGGDEEAPPSYEQAAKAAPYVPPAGHPNHPESSPTASTSTVSFNTRTRRRASAGVPPNAGPSTPSAGRQQHRQTQSVAAGSGANGNAGKDKDCSVM